MYGRMPHAARVLFFAVEVFPAQQQETVAFVCLICRRGQRCWRTTLQTHPPAVRHRQYLENFGLVHSNRGPTRAVGGGAPFF